MFLFTTTTCGHCGTLLSDPIIRDAIQSGVVENTDLYDIDPLEREEIFKKYNQKRGVPFLVFGDNDGKYHAVVGTDPIKEIVSQL